ncbi:hypothetical protein GCM10027059_47220 [Myceligenerans halotolerans]
MNKIGTAVRGSVACVAAAMMIGMGSAPAAAAADSSDLRRLVELTPGATQSQVVAAVKDVARTEGVTFDAAVDQALAETERATSEPSTVAGGGLRAAASSDPGGGDVLLGSAQRRGDVFWSPSSTAGVEHGHDGIYYTTSSIVEAPGTGELSRLVSAAQRYVPEGSLKQAVSATTAQRESAADYAHDAMLGREYNVIFWANKSYDGAVNCSQLVWATYHATSGIDLDGNGGWGVYPNDIRDSSLTSTYAWL